MARDDAGLVLDNVDAARRRAVQPLPQMTRDVLSDGEETQVSVTVRDQVGRRRSAPS